MTLEARLQTEFKNLRDQLGLTQKQLADQLEVSPVYISYLENGTRTPSRKLLKKAFQLAGHADLPSSIAKIFKELKAPQVQEPERSNTVYQLQAKGLYSLAKLQRLVKAHPDQLVYVLGLYQLYCEQGRQQEADQVILGAIPLLSEPEDRKWLEAYHFQLEGSAQGYQRALEIMAEALAIFEQRHPQPAPAQLEKKAELLFRLALIHYDFGVCLFYAAPHLAPVQLEAATDQFRAALGRHQQLQALCPYPYALMDYANLWFWLSLLARYKAHFGPEAERERLRQDEWQALQQFITASQYALIQHHRDTWETEEQSYFAKEYLLLNHSYVALAHAQLALLESSEAALSFLHQGEWLLAQHTPVPSQDQETVYRYYYNLAHFYSLKAESLERHSSPAAAVETALGLCMRGLEAAHKADAASLADDLRLPLEMHYFQLKNPQALDALRGGKDHAS